MIVLDTNVLSELLRPVPEPRVLAWLDMQPRAALFTTTITQAEILYGASVLPKGKRRKMLLEAVQAIFVADMAGQVLSFDNDAANAYAQIAASRRAQGRPISQFDALIAAVTRSRGGSLATRNVTDFADCGIQVINPWQ